MKPIWLPFVLFFNVMGSFAYIPSSIHSQDSNPQPLGFASSSLTTRPWWFLGKKSFLAKKQPYVDLFLKKLIAWLVLFLQSDSFSFSKDNNLPGSELPNLEAQFAGYLMSLPPPPEFPDPKP